jgi:hypothetical protein
MCHKSIAVGVANNITMGFNVSLRKEMGIWQYLLIDGTNLYLGI